MNEERITLGQTWRNQLSDRRFRIDFFISVFFLAVILFGLTRFLNYAEQRNGMQFSDPLLELFTAVDLTWIIFAVIYLSIVSAIFSLLPHPKELLFALQLYAVMVLVRITAMYLLPLNPPEGMIILQDPFVEVFGTGKTLTKDLFFSGHTASILIFFLTAKNRIFKSIFLLLSVLIAVLVILQKVHYTIDVYAAIFFTTACYFLLKIIKERYGI
jgi:hypothetical protein